MGSRSRGGPRLCVGAPGELVDMESGYVYHTRYPTPVSHSAEPGAAPSTLATPAPHTQSVSTAHTPITPENVLDIARQYLIVKGKYSPSPEKKYSTSLNSTNSPGPDTGLPAPATLLPEARSQQFSKTGDSDAASSQTEVCQNASVDRWGNLLRRAFSSVLYVRRSMDSFLGRDWDRLLSGHLQWWSSFNQHKHVPSKVWDVKLRAARKLFFILHFYKFARLDKDRQVVPYDGLLPYYFNMWDRFYSIAPRKLRRWGIMCVSCLRQLGTKYWDIASLRPECPWHIARHTTSLHYGVPLFKWCKYCKCQVTTMYWWSDAWQVAHGEDTMWSMEQLDPEDEARYCCGAKELSWFNQEVRSGRQLLDEEGTPVDSYTGDFVDDFEDVMHDIGLVTDFD